MTAPLQITAGFMPLLDSALLVVAKEMGFAAEQGLDLRLVRESSWANIRDRLAVGHFDVAHMLAPMPIACNLGLTPLAAPTIAPMALGLGGNAVTVSTALWQAMAGAGAQPDLDPLSDGQRAQGGDRQPLDASAAAFRRRASAFRAQLRVALLACRHAASTRTATSRSSSCRRR